MPSFADIDTMKAALESRGYIVTSPSDQGFGDNTRTAIITRTPISREQMVAPIKYLPVTDTRWKGKIWVTSMGAPDTANAKWGKLYVTGDPDFIAEIETP